MQRIVCTLPKLIRFPPALASNKLWLPFQTEMKSHLSFSLVIIFERLRSSGFKGSLQTPRQRRPVVCLCLDRVTSNQVKNKSWFGLQAALRDLVYDWTLQKESLAALEQCMETQPHCFRNLLIGFFKSSALAVIT